MPVRKANKHHYETIEYKLMADIVKKEAKYRCKMCKSKHDKNNPQKILTTHHIDGDPENNEKTNLMALCAECHLRIESMNRKLIKHIKENLLNTFNYREK